MLSAHDMTLGSFLALFHGERHSSLVVINTSTGEIQCADFASGEERGPQAQAWAEKWNAAGFAIYFAINPLKAPVGQKSKKSNVLEARWVWVECDPPEDLIEPALGAWREDKLSELRAAKEGVGPPTLLLRSGRGVWAFWKLREPQPLDGYGPQTERVEARGRGLEQVFAADKCRNVDRIARLPGFVNHRTGAKACIVEYHAERLCDFDDLPSAEFARAAATDLIDEDLRDLVDDEAAKAAVIDYLKSAAPLAVQGQNGRKTTMTVLQRCGDLGCRSDTAVELMEAHWNDRCSPPWEADAIAFEMRGLERKSPIACDHPAARERYTAKIATKWTETILDGAETKIAPVPDKYPLKFHGDPDDSPLKKWLLLKTLPEVGVALLSGQSGTYKTFLTFDLAAAVMVKASFAHRQVKRQGGVLFIAAESQDEIRARLLGVIRAKVETTVGAPADGRLPIDPGRLPFAWIEQSPALAAAGDLALKELREIVTKADSELKARTGFPIVLIVIDTLMAAADLKDANDRAESQRVMNLLRKIAFEFGVLVLVVDHFGKDETRGTAGASSKEAAADTVLAALGEKTTAGKVTRTRLALRKVRGAAQGVEIDYFTRRVTLGFDAEGGIEDTLVIEWPTGEKPRSDKPEWPKKLRTFRAAVETCLGKIGAPARPEPSGPEVRVVDREEVRAEFVRTYPADKSDAKRQAFKRGEREALSEGLIMLRDIEAGGAMRSVFWIPGSTSEGSAGTISETSGTVAGPDT